MTSPPIISPLMLAQKQALNAPLGNVMAMPSAAQRNELGTPIGRINELGGSLPSVGEAPIADPSASVSLALPTQLQRDVTEYNRQKNTGSGVSQIHNPLLRGI